ncbi:hypothetical protein [Azospirillum griseum]|uniref:Uncharacterized protein n=1 Tax=Azospirillum griseum TaxID=2496639 RepID=A0A431VG03_9PROT|nr:hypothetical protein [Azospirillum griseum]RTR18662.1 hypothetical protein EJ903_15620 [Azospirillum griseum]
MSNPLTNRDSTALLPAADPVVVWVPLPEGLVFDCEGDGGSYNAVSLWNRLSGAWLTRIAARRAA